MVERRSRRRSRRPIRSSTRPALGLVLLLAASLPFLGGPSAPASRALASQNSGLLHIASPANTAVVGDGNLVLIEGTATDPVDGVVDEVGIAFDGDTTWSVAERDPADPGRWRYVWSDPTPGFHKIRARALGVGTLGVVEDSVDVKVENTWATSYILDNPYGLPGTYRKGQLHVHSTNSFDGWTSLPPAHLALAYRDRGYQFVVITDHDVVTYPKEVNDDSFLVIPGYESTSDSGHITGVFVEEPVSPSLRPQERINHMTTQGGLAILNHPGWRVGWTNGDFRSLGNYVGFEIYNFVTSNLQERARRNTLLWHEALNAKGWTQRIWAVAVDDAHSPDAIDKGWVMVKCPQLNQAAIRQALENGSFYASNGPSFSVLGVLGGAITAASPDATTIRFIDQDLRVLAESPAAWASYKPSGNERWVRVEANRSDGRTAWSQPFWMIPNAPKVSVVPAPTGVALAGQTIPRARVHISDRGEYLGNITANDEGQFSYASSALQNAPHDFWVMATAPWPDDVAGPPALLAYSP